MACEFTKLLIHSDTFDGDNTFVDSSPGNHPITPFEGAEHSTSQSKFGATGIDLSSDLAGEYYRNLKIPTSPDFNLETDGTALSTIDFWMYREDAVAWTRDIISKEASGNGFIISTTNSQELTVRSHGVSHTAVGTLVPLAIWTHIAVTCDGTNVRLFQGGVLIHTGTCASLEWEATSDLIIGWRHGSKPGSSLGIMAPLDEIRVQKGVCEWTSNFTPPTAPYSCAPPAPPSDIVIAESVAVSNFINTNFIPR